MKTTAKLKYELQTTRDMIEVKSIMIRLDHETRHIRDMIKLRGELGGRYSHGAELEDLNHVRALSKRLIDATLNMSNHINGKPYVSPAKFK